MARHGGMLQVHCEDPVLLDAAVADALARGDTAPRFHADVPAAVRGGRRDGARPGLRPAGRGARPRRPPLVGRGARRGPAGQGGRCPRHGRDVPALPRPDRGALRRPGSGGVRPLRHLAAAPVRGRPRRAVGRTGRRLARPGRDGPRPRPPRYREGRGGRAACRSTGSRTARPASRRSWRSCTARAWPRAGSPSSGWSTSSRRRPRGTVRARIEGRDRGRQRRRPRALRPGRPTDDPRRRPPSHQRLHAVRGPRGRWRRPVGVRARTSGRPRRRRSSASAGSAGSSSEGRSKPRDGGPAEHHVEAQQDPGDAVEGDARQRDRAEDRRVRRRSELRADRCRGSPAGIRRRARVRPIA